MKRKLRSILSMIFAIGFLVSCNQTTPEEPISSNYGTMEDPITVAQAIELCDKQMVNATTSKEVFIKGKILILNYDSVAKAYTFKLFTGSIKEFEVKDCVLANNSVAPAIGDTVSVKGYAKHKQTETLDYYCMEFISSADYHPSIYAIEGKTPTGGDDPVVPGPIPEGETYGTLAQPITIAQAKTVIDTLEENAFSDKKAYVTAEIGTISYNSTFDSYTATVKNESNFELYSFKKGNFDAPVVGDTIVIFGYLRNFTKNGEMKYEVAYCSAKDDSPVVVALTKGTGPVVPPTPTGTLGTLENPLTIAQAKVEMDKLGANVYSAQKAYVTGTLGTLSYNSKYDSYSCFDKNVSDFQFYSIKKGSFADIKEGDTVTVLGYLYLYSNDKGSTYEVTFQKINDVEDPATIVKLTEGEGHVSVAGFPEYTLGDPTQPIQAGVGYKLSLSSACATIEKDKTLITYTGNYIQILNKKASSATDLALNDQHARFYVGSEVQISCTEPGHTIKTVILLGTGVANNKDYTSNLAAAMGSELRNGEYVAKVGINSNIYSFSITSGQARASEIIVIFN